MAVCLVVVGASQPGSPFALKLPGAWFFGLPGPGGPPRQGNFWGVAAVWVGLLGMARAWWLLCRALRRSPGLPPARLAWVVVLWCVPLLIGPPLLSRDVYIYAAYGDLLTLGLNPYHFGPGALAGGGFLHLVDPIWRSTPAPYGPLFPPLSAFVVRLTAHHPLGAVVGLRLVALAGVGLAAWSLPVVARAHDRDPALAVALGILNPVTLCGFVAGSHNDALMIGLVLAALALASRGRTAVALVVASLAAAVKVP
ncbi:MAG: polyprenol phosphomannose-dependent alpha 1,6 mannosyltransferase MptB, partial [Acidimicrobiales bacterium]